MLPPDPSTDPTPKTLSPKPETPNLQTVEMENSALRAEQKGMAPAERMTLLERDVAHKLHAHLEHATSVPNILCTILKRF